MAMRVGVRSAARVANGWYITATSYEENDMYDQVDRVLLRMPFRVIQFHLQSRKVGGTGVGWEDSREISKYNVWVA